ncbi:hypothetical protein VPHK567_0253 [Vibrio phage K567]
MYTDPDIIKTRTFIKSAHGQALMCNVDLSDTLLDANSDQEAVLVQYIATDEFENTDFDESEYAELDSYMYCGYWSKSYIMGLQLPIKSV